MLQISLELLHAILSIDVRREELRVEQVAHKLGCLLAANACTTCEKQAATRHREDTLDVGDQVKHFLNELDVELLELTFVSAHRLLDHLKVVCLRDPSHVRYAWNG